jgi:hypothetical protein
MLRRALVRARGELRPLVASTSCVGRVSYAPAAATVPLCGLLDVQVRCLSKRGEPSLVTAIITHVS